MMLTGCARRNSSAVPAPTATWFPDDPAAAAVPATAPMPAPHAAPSPPSMIAPMPAPSAAPPMIFFAGFLPSAV